MTARQALLAHLAEYHSSGARRSPAKRRGGWRAYQSLAELQQAHSYMHHHYGGPLMSHRHGRPNELNLGPDSRPEGWRTGLDVVLQPS